MRFSSITTIVTCLAGLALAQTSESPVSTVSSMTISTASAQATTPITIQGNAFFRGSDRFYIRGVDYQPGGSSSDVDPLGDDSNCARDIPYFQQLGVNTIRVYQVDNSVSHDTCMNLLKQAGIYLVLDVNTAKIAINQDDAASSYNAIYLQHVFATIDAFKNYDNTMAFFAGNEVVNNDQNVPAAVWVKATVRDMKQYMNAQSERYIPIGYSAADVANSRLPLAEYFNCGSNDTRVDFYAFNTYEWCGDATYTSSGYDQLVSMFGNYSAPIFFSEYGCNNVQPREFGEVSAIYSTEMTPVFSGGLVYEWSQEPSDYGLVDVLSDTTLGLLPDYVNLESAFSNTANPTGSGGYVTGRSASTCPANTTTYSGTWAEDVLPAQPSAAALYMKNGAGTALGSNGPSNMGGGADAVVSGSAASATNSARSSSSTTSAAATSASSGGTRASSSTVSSASSSATADAQSSSSMNVGMSKEIMTCLSAFVGFIGVALFF